jgi:hypothetical protein
MEPEERVYTAAGADHERGLRGLRAGTRAEPDVASAWSRGAPLQHAIWTHPDCGRECALEVIHLHRAGAWGLSAPWELVRSGGLHSDGQSGGGCTGMVCSSW